MDGVIVDFDSGIAALSYEEFKEYEGRFAKCPNIFSKMVPHDGALEAVSRLEEQYDVYILSSPSWGNASAWSDKYEWISKHIPTMERKLILSSQKHLNIGHYLIDDRLVNGADRFCGEHIHFGSEPFHSWEVVLDYLINETLE